MMPVSHRMLTLGLLAAARLELAAANMYDVLEQTKQPPASCTHGCARWDDLEAEGSGIVESVRATVNSTGLYPVSLSEAAVNLPLSRYAWEYSTTSGRRQFRLSVGDYGRDGFRLYYDSKPGEWRRDT